jgi:NADPH:quinone reductase-like Zn-dependent oxidoreductase
MQTSRHHPNTADVAAIDPSSGQADESMQAIVQRRYGSSDVLALETTARPAIAADEVLIEVRAAGVDRGTWHLMTGLPLLVRLAGYGVTKPKQTVPGFDVAGRVVAVGPAVTRFAPGDEVFGIAKGSFAAYAAASEHKLARKPTTVTFEQAAIAAVSGITALQALTDVGHVQPGQRVLVIGASGGVGTYAVQLAKAHGAHVTAVAGTRNLDLVRSLGADDIIDYTTDDFVDGVSRYDLIVDIGGRNSISRLRSVLARSGVLVIVGGEGGNRVTGGVGRQLRAKVLSLFVRQRLTTFISKEDSTFIERLGAHIESGDVVPVIGRRFALGEVPLAVRLLEQGETNAKSVIVVRSPEADDHESATVRQGADR